MDLQKAAYMFDTNTFRIIGCNQSFCDLTGFSMDELRNMSLFNMLPERLREPWKLLLQWASLSAIRTVRNTSFFVMFFVVFSLFFVFLFDFGCFVNVVNFCIFGLFRLC